MKTFIIRKGCVRSLSYFSRLFQSALGMIMFVQAASSQSTRLSLLEEFTGENCPPCAATNPGLNALLRLQSTRTKMIAIKWQVPIPSTPTATWSLYQTNKTEIDWRYQPAPAGYGYQSQWTSSVNPSGGINAAPTGLIDGRHLWEFGTGSDHPGAITSQVITTAQSYTTPFALSIAREWNSSFTAIQATVNVLANAAFTSTGQLVLRLVMTERHISFSSPPGTNGEKEFDDVARASFPSLQSGTPLQGSWTPGSSQSFTFSCSIPSHLINKAEAALVAFIQDDGTRRIYQAALADAQGTVDDAAAEGADVDETVCGSTISPTLTLRNHGTNAISSAEIISKIDQAAVSTFTWTGALPAGQQTTVTIPALAVGPAGHAYSYSIGNVNGGPDSYAGNNSAQTTFVSAPSFAGFGPRQDFSGSTFPPSGWASMNRDRGLYAWSGVNNIGAYGVNTGAARYDFYNNGAAGDVDDLYLPPVDLAATPTPSLFFDVAHAPYPDYTDGLMVQLSTDCGANWQSLYNKAGSALATAANQTTEFFPASSQWRTEKIDLAAYAAQKVLIRFRAVNGNGNNLWLDNVNITNLDETAVTERSMANRATVMPNPAGRSISVNAPEQVTSFALFDQTGRLIMRVRGSQADISGIDAGVYSVRGETAAGPVFSRLVIAR